MTETWFAVLITWTTVLVLWTDAVAERHRNINRIINRELRRVGVLPRARRHRARYGTYPTKVTVARRSIADDVETWLKDGGR